MQILKDREVRFSYVLKNWEIRQKPNINPNEESNWPNI